MSAAGLGIMRIMSALPLLVFAYLLGSLPIGLLVGKAVKGIDVREHGSGNIGASNVWRLLGPFWGSLVFVLDVGKGFLPVLLARTHATPLSWLPVVAGLAAILGHNFSVFLKFKGGKGVATSCGVALGLSWQAGLIGLGTWLAVLGLTRYISVSSLVGTAAGAFGIWWLNDKRLPYGLFSLLATAFVFVKHRANIRRIQAGTEPKAFQKKDPPVEALKT